MSKIKANQSFSLTPSSKKTKIFSVLFLGGIILAILPILIVMANGGDTSEGPGGSGAILWAMMLTLPLGGLFSIFGLLGLAWESFSQRMKKAK